MCSIDEIVAYKICNISSPITWCCSGESKLSAVLCTYYASANKFCMRTCNICHHTTVLFSKKDRWAIKQIIKRWYLFVLHQFVSRSYCLSYLYLDFFGSKFIETSLAFIKISLLSSSTFYSLSSKCISLNLWPMNKVHRLSMEFPICLL